MSLSHRALITGITGQDGSYLAELLLSKGYEVHGMLRRTSNLSSRIHGLLDRHNDSDGRLELHYGDMADTMSLVRLLRNIQPHEVYNLAAQSHVRLSFDLPQYTADVTGVGVLRMLDAILEYQQRAGKQVRFYQASSSEMFGKVVETPQSESTPFYPRSPYACAKVYAYWQTVNYRESYDMYAVNGILFNHESPRRGEAFVTRKISKAVARIKLGLQDKLSLGNIEAQRDWGFAGDFIEAMWLMLQQDAPEDYVVATGQVHSVRDFLDAAFGHVGLDWANLVETDANMFRPAEVDILCGDATKAQEKLGWQPKVSFGELARMMVDHDLELARQES